MARGAPRSTSRFKWQAWEHIVVHVFPHPYFSNPPKNNIFDDSGSETRCRQKENKGLSLRKCDIQEKLKTIFLPSRYYVKNTIFSCSGGGRFDQLFPGPRKYASPLAYLSGPAKGKSQPQSAKTLRTTTSKIIEITKSTICSTRLSTSLF